jgi:hypothetical protein
MRWRELLGSLPAREYDRIAGSADDDAADSRDAESSMDGSDADDPADGSDVGHDAHPPHDAKHEAVEGAGEVRPDGGSGEFPGVEDPESTLFVWGPTSDGVTRDEADDHEAADGSADGDEDGAGESTDDDGTVRESTDDDGTVRESTVDDGEDGESASDDGEDGESASDDGVPTTEVAAIEERLADLDDAAAHLSIHAQNARLKLARDEPRDLAGVAYDVESEARAIRRAVGDIQSRLDGLRERLEAGSTGPERAGAGDSGQRQVAGDPREPQVTGNSREPRVTEPAEGTGPLDGRASAQLPAGDRQPPGPWRTAGVDLTTWPGHLARTDFDRIRKRVTPAETVLSGTVPSDVARFSLDDGELSFESLLALASTSGFGSPEGEPDVDGAGDA